MNFLKKMFGKKDSESPAETYESFWSWFAENQKMFFNVVSARKRVKEDFLDQISPRLQSIHPGFYFLAGMYDDQTAELIITADGDLKTMVFVEELIQAAPQLGGWRFTALKPAADDGFQIRVGDRMFSADNLYFYAAESDAYPDEIDITIVSPEAGSKESAQGITLFLDNYLGEMNFAVSIDHFKIVNSSEAAQELIPISKLKAYLVWREKEFVEKYEGVSYGREAGFSMLEAELKNGNMLLAMVNVELLDWNAKASHPWILTVTVNFDGANGLPDAPTADLLNDLEDAIIAGLPEAAGYLYIGRETANGVREIYFACREFRKPSKVMSEIERKYADRLQVSTDIYKDKYWKTFQRFMQQ